MQCHAEKKTDYNTFDRIWKGVLMKIITKYSKENELLPQHFFFITIYLQIRVCGKDSSPFFPKNKSKESHVVIDFLCKLQAYEIKIAVACLIPISYPSHTSSNS